MIDFCDLSLPQATEESIWKKCRNLVRQNGYVLSKEVDDFENDFARFCEANHCLGVATGCDALMWAMEGLGIGRGDEVITVANTFIGTVLPIIRVGATPVLVDCDPKTQQIDPDQVASAITPRTSAIVPVHLYGRLAPMDELLRLCNKNGLVLLEDAAQAHGARYKGKRAGSMGHASGFSFYPAKNLGAWGDGGAMVTSDTSLYEKVKKIRNYGQEKKYFHSQIGWNSRLDSLQAIVLAEKLLLLDQWNESRRSIASRYYDILSDTEVSLYHESPENEPVHHLFVVTHKNRDLIQSKLNSQGIATGIHYPVPIHKHKCFANEPFAKDGCFPHAEAQSAQLLSLPMHPNMTISEVETVFQCLKAI